MDWIAQLNITNQTGFRIDVINKDSQKIGEVSPKGTLSWHTSDKNNSNTLLFLDLTDHLKMKAKINFASEFVSLDTEFVTNGDNQISLSGDVSGLPYTHLQNEGLIEVKWHELEEYASVNMTFDPVLAG